MSLIERGDCRRCGKRWLIEGKCPDCDRHPEPPSTSQRRATGQQTERPAEAPSHAGHQGRATSPAGHSDSPTHGPAVGIKEKATGGRLADAMESDRQAARDGYNPNW